MKLLDWFFFLALFLIFLLPPTDPDLGWQLRCGEEIWQGRGFCDQNHFTVLLPDYSWPNHAWGYQAIIYPVFRFFGLYGLTIFNALLMTAAFGFLYFATHRCSSAIHCALGILATIYFGWGVFSFGIRSQLLGFFFFNLTLYLLTKFEPNKLNPRSRHQFVLPLIMFLWANTHGSVVLGLILIGLFYLAAVVGKRERTLRAAATTVISGLITLINPFGFRIYEEMWRHFAGPIDLSKLIAEWVPPVPQVQQLIVISGVVVFVYLLFKSLRTPSIIPNSLFLIPALFLIPIFAFLALRARRNVPFYFVILSYSLLSVLKAKISPLRNQLAALLSVGILLYGLIVQLPQTIETNSSWENFCQNKSLVLPCEAVEFLKKQGPPGGEASNIFNRYEWGGFLIWQLPEYKIFVDGRMPAWGKSVSPYTIYLETLQTQPGWQETLAQYNITYLLISPGTFMDLKLQPNPQNFGWQEVYRDKIAVGYRKL